MDERRKIARWRTAGISVDVIAEKLGRHRSTIRVSKVPPAARGNVPLIVSKDSFYIAGAMQNPLDTDVIVMN